MVWIQIKTIHVILFGEASSTYSRLEVKLKKEVRFRLRNKKITEVLERVKVINDRGAQGRGAA